MGAQLHDKATRRIRRMCAVSAACLGFGWLRLAAAQFASSPAHPHHTSALAVVGLVGLPAVMAAFLLLRRHVGRPAVLLSGLQSRGLLVVSSALPVTLAAFVATFAAWVIQMQITGAYPNWP